MYFSTSASGGNHPHSQSGSEDVGGGSKGNTALQRLSSNSGGSSDVTRVVKILKQNEPLVNTVCKFDLGFFKGVKGGPRGAQATTIFGTTKTSASFKNAQSRFAPPRLVPYNWECPCISVSGSNARGESRAFEGRCVCSKSPSRVRDGDEGAAGRNGRE